jgi:hypothetical protein
MRGTLISSLVMDATGRKGEGICGAYEHQEQFACFSMLEKEKASMNKVVE